MKHTLIAHIYRGLKRFSSRNSRVHIPGDEFRLAIWIISQLLRDRLVQPPTSSPALLSRNIHENRAFYPVIVRIVSNHIFQHIRIIQFPRVNGRRTGWTTTGHRLHPAGSSENSIVYKRSTVLSLARKRSVSLLVGYNIKWERNRGFRAPIGGKSEPRAGDIFRYFLFYISEHFAFF